METVWIVVEVGWEHATIKAVLASRAAAEAYRAEIATFRLDDDDEMRWIVNDSISEDVVMIDEWRIGRPVHA